MSSMQVWHHATIEQLRTIRAGKASQHRIHRQLREKAEYQMLGWSDRYLESNATAEMLDAEIAVIDSMIAEKEESHV